MENALLSRFAFHSLGAAITLTVVLVVVVIRREIDKRRAWQCHYLIDKINK